MESLLSCYYKKYLYISLVWAVVLVKRNYSDKKVSVARRQRGVPTRFN